MQLSHHHTTYFHVIIQNDLKNNSAGKYCRKNWIAAAHSSTEVLWLDSADKRKELQVCPRADLTEKLKTWHFETIGWAAKSTFVSVLTSNKSLHIVRQSRSCTGTISCKLKGSWSDRHWRQDIRISVQNLDAEIISLFFFFLSASFFTSSNIHFLLEFNNDSIPR